MKKFINKFIKLSKKDFNNNLIQYDFGSGWNKRPGCIGVDFQAGPGVDIVADITKKIECIEDGSADAVYCSHTLEHIPYPFHWDALKEMIRVLKFHGHFELIVPHPSRDSAMVPDHKHVFSVQYFEDMQKNPLPNMIVDKIFLRRTPYFDKIKKLTKFDDEIIENTFRNVIEEIIIHGRKI
jgi:ubiquinone/menaquinone biosynthesis C-methylase UbiE